MSQSTNSISRFSVAANAERKSITQNEITTHLHPNAKLQIETLYSVGYLLTKKYQSFTVYDFQPGIGECDVDPLIFEGKDSE